MVKYTGHFTRKEVNNIYKNSKAGLVIFQPAKNHMNAQPNKLFEYMAAGLPVIASNFPLWREIVEGSNCGKCVNPTDVEEVRKACVFFLTHDRETEQMGRNGRKTVQNLYNWDNEEKVLLKLYEEL